MLDQSSIRHGRTCISCLVLSCLRVITLNIYDNLTAASPEQHKRTLMSSNISHTWIYKALWFTKYWEPYHVYGLKHCHIGGPQRFDLNRQFGYTNNCNQHTVEIHIWISITYNLLFFHFTESTTFRTQIQSFLNQWKLMTAGFLACVKCCAGNWPCD